MTTIRRTVGRPSVALVLAVALVAAACGNDDDSSADAGEEGGSGELTTIDFLQPLPKSMAFYPLFVGDALGYFEDEGIRVNLLPSGDIPATVIVPTGEADIGATTPQNIVQGAASGEDFSLIYEYYQQNVVSIVVPADSDVQSIEDMAGRNMGVTSEGAGDAALARNALGQAGLEPDEDVTITVAGEGGPAVADALTGGRLDAFSGAINDIVALQAAGVELRDITPDHFAAFPASSMIVRNDTLQEDPELLTGFLRAWSKATYAGLQDPDLVYELAQDEVPEETEDETFGRLFLDLAIDLQTPAEGDDAFGALRPDAWDTVQEEMVLGGEIDEEFDFSPYLDDSLLGGANDWDRAEVESDVEAFRAQ